MPNCRKCDVKLAVDENWWPSCAKNHNYICIKCHMAYQRQYCAHSEKRREYSRQYRAQHREEHKEYKRQWLEEHPGYNHQCYAERREEINERHRQWRAEHLDYPRQYRAEHQEEVRDWHRQWRKANPGKAREKNRRYLARKVGATIESVDEVAIYERCGNHCIYCGATKNLELDHVTPLNGGGPHCEDNLIVACRSCNASKGDKPLEQWLQTQPRARAWVV